MAQLRKRCALHTGCRIARRKWMCRSTAARCHQLLTLLLPRYCSVAVLRRIRNLFLQFIETPEFNPAAATLAVAPAGFC